MRSGVFVRVSDKRWTDAPTTLGEEGGGIRRATLIVGGRNRRSCHKYHTTMCVLCSEGPWSLHLSARGVLPHLRGAAGAPLPSRSPFTGLRRLGCFAQTVPRSARNGRAPSYSENALAMTACRTLRRFLVGTSAPWPSEASSSAWMPAPTASLRASSKCAPVPAAADTLAHTPHTRRRSALGVPRPGVVSVRNPHLGLGNRARRERGR